MTLRWDGQRVDRVDDGTLPGLARMSGFVRSVRTPEFRDVTCHEVLAKSALNHVPQDARMLPGEWTINPYRGCAHACQYCFARPTHTRLGLNVAGDFDREIVVKTNIVAVLRAELARRRVLPPRVAFGTSTDVYQRAEGRYQLMPGIIDALAGARVPFSILTKSPLIRRDLDRLVAASRVTTVHLGLSISMLDEELRESVEFGTATSAARLATVREIRDAGLACTVFLSPVLPHLNDGPEQLRALLAAVTRAGATSVLYTPLYLSNGVREVFFTWLRRAHPALVEEYTRLYGKGGTREYRDTLRERILPLIAEYGLPAPDESVEDRFALHGRRGRVAEPAQPTLF
ncbi:radical SAM protein [Actinophytocola sp.]|uniref:radical SAM protein n=1 Tax=Actinophytocola sp. TaxID=1872138 RepID=UPI003899B7A1